MKKPLLLVPFVCAAAVVRCVGDTSTNDGGTDATSDVANDVASDTGPADTGSDAGMETGPLPCTFPEGGASGTLDMTFNAQFYSNIYNSSALAFDNAGKIYVVGYDPTPRFQNTTPSPLCGVVGTSSQGGIAAYVVKFANDGTRDNTFGVADSGAGGRVCVSVPGYYTADFQAVAADPDGSLVAVGFVRDTYPSSATGVRTLIVRVTAAGALDTTFGTNGVVLYDAITSDRSAAYAVALDSSGGPAKIVVAGSNADFYDTANTKSWVMRFNHDGSPDMISFNGGNAIVDTNANAYLGLAVVNHDIFVTGYAGTSPQHAIVRKVLSTGAFDPSFGGGNAVIISLGTGTTPIGEGVAPLADSGSVAVSGLSDPMTQEAVVTALGVDGGVNTSFGTAGTTQLVSGTLPAYFSPTYQFGMLTTDCEHRLLVSASVDLDASYVSDTGETNFDEATVARLLTNGSLDSTFGQSGFGFVGASFNSSAASAAVEDPVTGRIVLILRSRGGVADARLGLVRLYR